MNANPLDVERFRGIVASRMGLNFDDSKLGFLADVLKRHQETIGQSSAAYLGQLELSGRDRAAWRALAADLTVNETYFFRNPDQFRALTHAALPERRAANASSRHIRVLSAGCSSGEEAYTLAIILRETMPDPSWTISVHAFDISPTVLEKARRGRYSAWSLRETSPEMQQRWFVREGNEFALDRSIRDAVSFEERNFADENADLWKPAFYDIVFCRNVIMYFTPELAQTVVARIARSLVPGGYFFLGHAETLRGLSQDFHLQHTHDTFYYRSKSEAERQVLDATSEYLPSPPPAFEVLPAVVDEGAGWVDSIRRASERIQALTDNSRAGHDTKPDVSAARDLAHRAQLLELLGRERFDDALALARTLSTESSKDPDLLLLRAALLTHAGQFPAAQTACEDLLRIDEMNAGAHYLLALCKEGSGDAADAREHDRVAAYLDPAFAMPRLHLGLLARRAGDRVGARAEFGHALTLLLREDAMRLLLFGGGFGRDALLALCRAEFTACGGRA